jgi:HSP20 family molecular chaperone IbpA
MRDHKAALAYADNGDFLLRLDASGFIRQELSVDIDGDDITVRGAHDSLRDRKFVKFPRGLLKFLS